MQLMHLILLLVLPCLAQCSLPKNGMCWIGLASHLAASDAQLDAEECILLPLIPNDREGIENLQNSLHHTVKESRSSHLSSISIALPSSLLFSSRHQRFSVFIHVAEQEEALKGVSILPNSRMHITLSV